MKIDDLLNLPGVTVGPSVADGMAKLVAATGKPTTIASPALVRRLAIVVELALTVKSEANIRNGARAKMARTKATREAVLAAMPKMILRTPVVVTLTKLGSKRLDSDNLATAFKACRDAIADWLGVDDGDEKTVRWAYLQRPSYYAGIRIEVEQA